jgi:UDP-GlcNAc:undecaprenyl-phosphate/decaprenyl-phosphate GlcNAc-1-phosphate transferase
VPRRANYRGRQVLFPVGVVLLAAAALAMAASPNRWLVFLLGVGCLGLIDDLAGGEPRGLRGHGLALVRGELSTGAIKAIGTVAFAAYAVAGEDPSGAELMIDVLVLALSAHLGNLLDTRPGRPEKAVGLIGAGICLGSWSLSPLEPIAPLVPTMAICAWLTLRERAMLGDAGASLIGGMIGILLVTTLSIPWTLPVLAGLIVISLYGELRSISSAIGQIPLLERLDSLGRVN